MNTTGQVALVSSIVSKWLHHGRQLKSADGQRNGQTYTAAQFINAAALVANPDLNLSLGVY